jgi:hypothetical protein
MSERFVADNSLTRGASRMWQTIMLRPRKKKLSDFFRDSPLAKIELDLRRDKSSLRTDSLGARSFFPNWRAKRP